MATNLPSCFSIEFLEQLLKFVANFTLLKYVKSQRSYGFLITKKLIFGFQILDLKVRFSASLNQYSKARIDPIKYWESSIEHGGMRPFFYMVDQYFGKYSLEPFEYIFMAPYTL